jgi:uncharacterized delta-60 repeat protein
MQAYVLTDTESVARMLRTAALLLCIAATAAGQTERWFFRLDAPPCNDLARAIVYGADSNFYVAGFTTDVTTWGDFAVLSLTSDGEFRWRYRYDGPGHGWDEAMSIAYGSDGNVYAAGLSSDAADRSSFTVVSLTPEGEERWVYRLTGTYPYDNVARSVVCGGDGNIYAAGETDWYTYSDFTVLSLSPSGSRRWLYHYNGTRNLEDTARSVIWGLDGNIYAAGSTQSAYNDITVVSLTPDGTQRWVYRYNGPAGTGDYGFSITCGPDSTLCVAGISDGGASTHDFAVVCLRPDGTQRWVYRCNGPGNGRDLANSVACGPDGNVYAAGWTLGDGTGDDFTVVGLSDSGVERWEYRLDGQAGADDRAYSVVVGSDNEIYVAGYTTDYDDIGARFTIVSLDTLGARRWVYRRGNQGGEASCLLYGPDDNLYGAGRVDSTSEDMAVVCLCPLTGVADRFERDSPQGLVLAIRTIQRRRIDYCVTLPQPGVVAFSVHDPLGRKLLAWRVRTTTARSYFTQTLPTTLGSGVYVLSATDPATASRCTSKLVMP